MKILFISNMYPSFEFPYAGIYVKNQFEYLKKNSNMEMFLFSMKRTKTTKFGSLLKYVFSTFRFLKLLFYRFDVVHVHYAFPFLILAYFYKAIHPKTKVVVTFHGGDFNNFVCKRGFATLYSRLLKKCDCIISVSRDLANRIEKRLNLKVDVIMSAGIDEKVFYRETEKKIYDFLFVGSFTEKKGVDILLDSIKLINNPSLKFCFVGAGYLESEIRTIAKDYSIEILGSLDQVELRKIYSKSKFFILPSRYEGFGLVASESMFCGTPVIVTNEGGLKEQVENGVNGYFIYQNDAKTIVELLKSTSKMEIEKYENMKDQAFKSNTQHALSNVCKKTQNIYYDILIHDNQTNVL